MSAPTEAQIAHQQLLEQLDINALPKSFRNPSWRPNQRRNKNIKTILGDASRREASALATPQQHLDSGALTPTSSAMDVDSDASDAAVAAAAPNLAQASRSLSKLVLEKSLRSATAAAAAPSATYTNIESAPSMAHQKRYCDVTGLPAPYLDPKTRLRYHNTEIFALMREFTAGVAEQYLEARGAHTILK